MNDKYSIDYSGLDKALSAPRTFRLKDVEHRLQKVAFGTVRFMDADADIDGLWEIQNTDDGEVIIAKYDYDEPKTVTSSWDVVPHNGQMNIFYKGESVIRVAAPNSSELPSICKNASIRLETDGEFRNMLLDELDVKAKAELFNKFPELDKG